MALLLAAIMRSDTASATALFLSLKASRSQRDALTAAATPVLKDHEMEAFGALMNVYKSLESERGALAHGVFGSSEQILDGVVWLDVANYVKHVVPWIAQMSTDMRSVTGSILDAIKPDLFVYRQQDLARLIEQINALWKGTSYLSFYVRFPDGAKGAEQFRQLCALSQIQREICRMREGQKNKT
jgi:hypothetical protein